MHKSFWFDTDLGSFLFPSYDVSTIGAFLATCFALLSLAVVYEAMKVFQMKLHRRTVSSLAPSVAGNSENSSLLTQLAPDVPGTSNANWDKWTTWILEVLHWSVHTTLGYLLMLAVMTFNGYIGIALIIGASLGYWIFGMTLIEMNLEQFHEARSKIAKCDPECADAVDNEESRDSVVSNLVEQPRVSAEVHATIG